VCIKQSPKITIETKKKSKARDPTGIFALQGPPETRNPTEERRKEEKRSQIPFLVVLGSSLGIVVCCPPSIRSATQHTFQPQVKYRKEN
jgi:hypothetical protein